ncbi:MAG: prepilin-type N-terminal cleavage/methylation domain-containing protein [bacterium]|nr:prepilin-type N-terminal cleavage/methylation domain-containing protein [bacterium]
MHKRGFTLVEIIVAVGLFAMVVVMAVSTLLVISNGNRRAQVSRQVLDNVDFILDDMIREIRLGKNFHCGAGNPSVASECLAGGSSFAFTRLDSNEVVIYDTALVNGKTVIRKQVGITGTPQVLTSEAVNIPLLTFTVSGSIANDKKFPKVSVNLTAEIMDKGDMSSVSFQTTIAQRASDN